MAKRLRKALTRRQFLNTVGCSAGAATVLGALGGCGEAEEKDTGKKTSKGATMIEKIETFNLRYPTKMYFKFFEGPPGVPPGRPAVLVKITTNDGHVGWGQSVPIQRWSYETPEAVIAAINGYIAPELKGKDPADFDAIHKIMNKAIAPSFSTGLPIGKAGIDLALHDLVGKMQDKNVAELWGKPKGGEVVLSWTMNPRKLDEIEGLIEEGWEQGFRHFNVKVGPDPKFDVEMCRRIKKRVPDGFLWADANGGYELKTALEAAPKLADEGVPVLEQPLPANHLDGYRQLVKQGALPILLDESVVNIRDLEEFHKLGMCNGASIKPARCAGLLDARRQVEYLQKNKMVVLGSGLTDPDLSLAASLILFAAYQIPPPAALNGPQFLKGTILKKPFEVKDGKLAVPAGPGLGVEVDESKIKDLTVKS